MTADVRWSRSTYDTQAVVDGTVQYVCIHLAQGHQLAASIQRPCTYPTLFFGSMYSMHAMLCSQSLFNTIFMQLV